MNRHLCMILIDDVVAMSAESENNATVMTAFADELRIADDLIAYR